jgi:hypothetical protein
MSAIGGPNIVEDGLVVALDAANEKSFRGEPTTNLTISDNNFTGTGYSPDGEWAPNPTVFNKSYDSSIKTPVGVGATLLSESGTGGFHHLSRWGGGGTGNHSLSCYIYPLSNDIDDFTVGLLGDTNNMITFNLINKTITYGGAAVANSAFIQTVDGFPGWLRVGGNHGGRDGGWVGCVGLLTGISYTGSAGAKSFYITGLQYETKPSPTFFTPAGTTRGTTVATGGGWADRSVNSNHGELVNGPTFDSSNLGSLVFDGVDDYTLLPTNFFSFPSLNTFTISLWLKSSQTTGGTLFGQQIGSNPSTSTGWVPVIYLQSDGKIRIEPFWTSSTSNFILSSHSLNDNNWYNIITTFNSGTNQLYVNGVYNTQQTGKTLTSFTSTYSYIIGAGYADGRSLGTNYFSGNISNFTFYNRALSAEEILQNYNAIKGRFGL